MMASKEAAKSAKRWRTSLATSNCTAIGISENSSENLHTVSAVSGSYSMKISVSIR